MVFLSCKLDTKYPLAPVGLKNVFTGAKFLSVHVQLPAQGLLKMPTASSAQIKTKMRRTAPK